MRSLSLLALLLASCAPGADGARPTDDADTDTDSDTESETARATLDGEITWAVDFLDASATDCSYTRHYVGVEDRSAPWLCGECDAVFLADVAIVSGRDDCYDLVATTAPPETEWIGYGGGTWYRGGGAWLTERGPATLDGGVLTLAQSVDAEASGGDWAFEITGTLDVGADDGDPYNGFVAPDTYACGWPKADPAPYTGDYVATVGETVPDGLFADACEETVRLHDFAGSYLLIDFSAMDCGPCQSAASEEEAFVDDMAAQGLDVHVVTLLVPSLSDTGGTPTTAELEDWIGAFELTSPVLADRMWGLSVVGRQIPDDFGYPTFLVVAPDLEVLDISVGFGSFDDLGATMLAHAGR